VDGCGGLLGVGVALLAFLRRLSQAGPCCPGRALSLAAALAHVRSIVWSYPGRTEVQKNGETKKKRMRETGKRGKRMKLREPPVLVGEFIRSRKNRSVSRRYASRYAGRLFVFFFGFRSSDIIKAPRPGTLNMTDLPIMIFFA
jgi:hypothetical protein